MTVLRRGLRWRGWHPARLGSSEALIADVEIALIYNPLPDQMHAECSIGALEAGKHVLCEKALALSAQEAASRHQSALRTQAGSPFGFLARSSFASTITTAPSTSGATSRSPSGQARGGPARSPPMVMSAAQQAIGLRSPLWRSGKVLYRRTIF